MNSYVILNARLVADPQTFEFGDQKMTELRVADNPMRRKLKDGSDAPARFVTCKVWGKQAETAAKLLKGDIIAPSGELGLEHYKAKDGTEKSKDVLHVNSFCILQSESFSASFGDTEETKPGKRSLPY